jgi:hypothetical protein
MNTVQRLLVDISEFEAWGGKKKLIWLSALIFTITQFARVTFEPGTDAVISPKTLRRISEIVHHVSAYQLALFNEKETMNAIDFFSYLDSAIEEAHLIHSEIRRAMAFCYRNL